MTEPKTVPVVVALVTDAAGRLLMTWNQKWKGFTLPMTRPEDGPTAESVEQAAVRAAAEVAGRPVQRVNGTRPRTTRDLRRSARDTQLKNYVYTVVPVELHPDFAGHAGHGFWAVPERLACGDYHPTTESVLPLVAELREWGWID